MHACERLSWLTGTMDFPAARGFLAMSRSACPFLSSLLMAAYSHGRVLYLMVLLRSVRQSPHQHHIPAEGMLWLVYV